MNPKTGEILAMVNRPSYDPNGLKEIMHLSMRSSMMMEYS